MNRSLLLASALAASLLLCSSPSPAQSSPWRLQGDIDLMAGQYFFNGSAGSINGYMSADLQLMRPQSSDSGFYFTGRSAYTGFKQVNELAGGGTLFQQSLDNVVGAKWIKRFDGGYSLKPRLGVHSQLFRETVDESWGKGLYDLWRYEAGVVLERKTRLGLGVPWTYQFSLDLYYTRYTRFKSLATQFGTELAAPNPGSRILDTVTTQLGYRSEFELPNFVSAWVFYSISFVNFTDQKVVQTQGQYLNVLRTDAYQSLSLGASKRLGDWQALGRVRPNLGLRVTLADLFSNQNHFDADPSRLRFIGAYYDYWEARIAPNMGATFLGTMTSLRAGCELAARYYTGRLSQNSDGSYQGRKLHQISETVFFEAAQPIGRGLEAKARGSWSNTSANTSFEQTYQYNYHDYNYFVGLGWKF